MNKATPLLIFAIFLFTACEIDEPITPDTGIPIVKAESSYTVLKEENITYADGLSHNATSITAFAIPLKLDLYYPDNDASNRPVFMFIHGGFWHLLGIHNQHDQGRKNVSHGHKGNDRASHLCNTLNTTQNHHTYQN